MTTTLKTCFKCNTEKSIDEFYKHRQMGDGHLNKCKACTKEGAATHRRKNIHKIREYDRNRGSRQPYSYVAEYRAANAEKYKAHKMVGNAVRDGKLTKPDRCSNCHSRESIVAHHPDYSKPMAVVWLCQPCHAQLHRLESVVEQEMSKTA